MVSLQGSPLPESVEILDILNKIEFEGLFYSHDKLADLQVKYLIKYFLFLLGQNLMNLSQVAELSTSGSNLESQS